MSILINGMEMPTGNNAVSIIIFPNGKVSLAHDHRFAEYAEAIPVPPHGDLIGREALWVEINKICDRRDAGIISDLTCLQQLLSAVRHAPTVIPASEGGES